ncbi:MAG TPA: hypothetical protein G4O02_08950 [Caldilineae bacterium]|nr:hypothetical protein [Caldilineae bacterium]
MRSRRPLLMALGVGFLIIALTVGVVQAECNISDWSTWQSNYTAIQPPRDGSGGNPTTRPIPIPNPGNAELQAWVNSIASFPSPAMVAHAEEVARGDDHSTIVGHGPAKDEPASRNAWATGGVLRNDSNPGPFFETFDEWYGNTWTWVPHRWGAYAYRGAEHVTFDREQVHKDESPYDGSYSLKIASTVPFEAGVSRTFYVPYDTEKVKVEVMYLLYDHGGKHGGNVWTYDWVALGVKAGCCDAEWVNGPYHGQWLPLSHEIVLDKAAMQEKCGLEEGADIPIMIFLQAHSLLPENTNAYFDNVRVWVDGEPYTE